MARASRGIKGIIEVSSWDPLSQSGHDHIAKQRIQAGQLIGAPMTTAIRIFTAVQAQPYRCCRRAAWLWTTMLVHLPVSLFISFFKRFPFLFCSHILAMDRRYTPALVGSGASGPLALPWNLFQCAAGRRVQHNGIKFRSGLFGAQAADVLSQLPT